MEPSLRLNDGQLTKLSEYLTRREGSLRADNKERITKDRESVKAYKNDKSGRMDGPFAYKNLSWPLLSMCVDHFIVRSEEEITGTAPYYHFNPHGGARDADMAIAADKYFRFRLDNESGLRARLEDAYFPIFTQRACILKATYDEVVDIWEERNRLVLFEGDSPVEIPDESGEDVRYVLYGEENWVPLAEMDPVAGETVVLGYRLEADPSITLPVELYDAEPDDPKWAQSQYTWQELEGPIAFREVAFKGPRSNMVDSDMFFAPTKVRSLSEADCLFEEYDKPLHWIRDRWMKRKGMSWTDFEAKLKAQKRNPHDDETGETERDKVSKETDEQNPDDVDIARFRIQEFWIEKDILGRGTPQRICVWREKQTQTIILAEYARVVFPDGKGRHPYDAVAICKLEDYWWGPSLPELLAQYQEEIDKLINGWLYRNTFQTGSVIGQKPDQFQDGELLEEIEPFVPVTLTDDGDLDDAIQIKTFPQTDAQTREIFMLIIQFVQLWLGVSNVSQGNIEGQKTNTTAYSVDASLRESGKISRRWSRRIIRALQSHIRKLVIIEVETMDKKAAYEFTEGDEQFIEWISRTDLKQFDWDVELVISNESSQTTVEANRLATDLVKDYAASPPDLQLRLRPLYKQSLIKLGHDQTDDLLPKPTAEDIALYQQQQMAMAMQGQADPNAPQGGGAQPPDNFSQSA